MLLKTYKKLYQSYGPQGWWPVTEENAVIKEKIKPDEKPENTKNAPTYHKADYSYPRTDKQAFEIILGAILTQNTSWKNVEKAITNLHRNNLVDADKLAEVNQKKLAALIRPAGYFNQKAERLKIIAGYIKDKYGSKVSKLFDKENDESGISELRNELLAVNGIGPETADSIILYAAKKPIFVVDAYTKRIFARIGLFGGKVYQQAQQNVHQQAQHQNKEKLKYEETKLKYEDVQKMFHENLERDHRLFNEYHALIVEHAKQHCKAKPVCRGCPLLDICGYEKKIL